MVRVLFFVAITLAGCAAPARYRDPYKVCYPYNQPACDGTTIHV